MKSLNSSIIGYCIKIIIAILLVVGLIVFITLKIINNDIRNVYVDNSMMIDIQPKIYKTLEKISDEKSFELKGNTINVTNNSTTTKKYQILLSPINNNDNDIRLSIDDYIIRYLNKYDKVDDNYLLYELSLDAGYTSINTIKVWLSNSSSLNNINVNFKLMVKVIDE